MAVDYSPASHYDRVTQAWQYLLGDELHYGVFDRGDEDLAEATGNLTRRMIGGARLERGLTVLDVGCGTGAPACDLAEQHGVEVVGITTSPVGVETATRRAAQRGLSDSVRFELRDGTANGLPDESFDRVWVLESSHLMRDREGLVAECARVLRPGGRMVLCDVMRMREIPFLEVRQRAAEFAALRAAFGSARMDTMAQYVDLATRNGLEVDMTEDLTAATLQTFAHWLANAERYRDEATAALGAESLAEFEEGSRILDALWREGTLGYGIFSAAKPEGA